MQNPIYFFIDESGDNGDNDGTGANSMHYSELLIQIKYGCFLPLMRHINKWRCEEGISSEPKHIPKDEDKCKSFLEPIIKLQEEGAINCSVVYLLKEKYTGPYLKTNSPYYNHRLSFRNFVHRQLFEHHFNLYPRAHDDYISVIFDYYRMGRSDFKNIDNYLCNICGFQLDNIIHFDSMCSWVLQLAGQLANGISRAQLGETPGSIKNILSCIPLKDITNI